MAELSEEIKDAIVRRLAEFAPPSQVAEEIREEFGERITRQQAAAYDPTTRAFKVGKKWVDIFHAYRKAHLTQIELTPSAHRDHRVARLHRMSLKAERTGNIVLAAALLEQISKEMGGIYTNVRNQHHTGKVERVNITPEDARTELAMRLASMREKIDAQNDNRPTETETGHGVASGSTN